MTNGLGISAAADAVTTPAKGMSMLDAAGDFSTALGMVSLAANVVSALASDDPGTALLAIIGLDVGNEPEYTLGDLRSEMMTKMDEQNDIASFMHLAYAESKTEKAMHQIQMYREDSSEVSAKDLISTADFAYFEARTFAETVLQNVDSPTAISAAINVFAEALAVRMAVVEVAQEGAWGKGSIQKIIVEADSFFNMAEAKYQQSRDSFLDQNPVKVGGGTPHPHTGITQIDYSADKDLRDAFRDIDDMVGTGATFSGNTVYMEDRFVKVLPQSEFADFLVNEQNFNQQNDGSVYLDTKDFWDMTMFKVFIDNYLSEASAIKEGYEFQEGHSIGTIADIFAAQVDGTSIVTKEGISSQGENALQGTGGKDFINGKDFHDEIYGNGGRDVIKGGSGEDVIDGGAGADVLYGGKADYSDDLDGDTDTFIFRNPEDVDTIKEFEVWGTQNEKNVDTGKYEVNIQHGDIIAIDLVAFDADHIVEKTDAGELDANAFTVGMANVTEDTVVFQEGGDLYFDADGSGTGYDAVHFATVIGSGDLIADNFAFI